MIDVIVQGERSILYGLQYRHGGHGFADGTGLKEGIGVDSGPILQVSDSVTFCPVNSEVLDDRNTHARHMKLRHEIFKGQGRKAVMITTLSAFDRMDVLRHGIHRRPPSTYSPLDFTRGVT
jgi:hypothetical protein